MKRLLLFAALAATSSSTFISFSFAQSVAFQDVHVVPMDEERIIEHQTVIIEGDRIVSMGHASEIDIPDSAQIIDGEGKYLMPGLAEMHGHIPRPNQATREIENVLFLYVANGITTVRGMLGHPGQLELRESAAGNERVSPTLYLAGPSFSGGSISSVEQAIQRVKLQKEEGWDLLKIHPGLTLDQYDAMANTANEVGITFGGHVPAAVGLDHALDMGQETFDHLDGYVEALDGANGPVNMFELGQVVAKTIEKGAWVVPTMALWETLYGAADLDELRSFEELKYTSPRIVTSWSNMYRSRVNGPGFDPFVSANVIDARMQILGALSDAGARMLMGTDAPQQFSIPGFSLRRELGVMRDAGMSPFEIIKSGTTNVGAYFEHQDTFGRVAEGHRADLILVNENPLEDVKHIADHSGVMTRGVWHSKDYIQERLDEIESYYANPN